jgi:TolB protein
MLKPRTVLVTAVAVGSLAAVPPASGSGAISPEQAPWSGTVGADPVAGSAAADDAPARAALRKQRNGRIVYHAYLPQIPEIFTIAPNGTRTLRLTHNDTYDQAPSWSPTGRRIIFGRFLGDGSPPVNELFTMRPDGSGVRQLTHDRTLSIHPSWSRARVAYDCLDSDDFEICTIKPDGSGRRQVTDNDVDDTNPDWSPDGRTIAYQCFDGNDMEICTMGRDGAGRQQLTQNTTDDFSPSFSPSGRRIVYSANERSADIEIYVIRAEGRPLARQITSNQKDDVYPSWSPDGRRIVYIHINALSGDLYTISPGGTQRRRVTRTAYDESEPEWGALSAA